MATKQVWKDILRPGVYRLRNGKIVRFTKDDVSNGEKQGKDMIAAGLNIPIALEHQSTATPEYLSDIKWTDEQKAEFVRNTVGHVSDFRVSDAGALEACHEFRDEKDAEIAAKARFVSPRIDENAIDSKGRSWPGKTVAHVAVTPVPVQIDQQPFELSGLPAGWKSDESLVLSKFEGDDVADKKDDKPADKPDDKKGDETPAKPVPDKTAPDAKFSLKDLVDQLADCGLNVGDNVTDLADLVSRLKGVAAVKSDGGDDDGLNALAGDGIKTGASPPVVMSNLEKKVQERQVATERVILNRRVDALFSSNRITGPIARKLKSDIGKVELSFVDDGNLAESNLVAVIKAYEELEAGVYAAKDEKKAELSTIKKPSEFDAKEPSKEGQAKAREWLMAK